MSRKRIVGPIFFTSTITGGVYHDIIQQFVSQLEKSECRSWLQQDNATNTTNFLREFFNERLISTNLWPPYNADLSLPDFFQWKYLKNSIHMSAPWNLEELKGNIAWEIVNID